MVVEDIQFLNVFKGKRIKLTLRTSSYLGVVQRINPNRTLVLADVRGSDGGKIPGSKIFFGREVLNVELVDETSIGSGLVDHSSMEGFQNIEFDDEKGEEQRIDFVVIDEFHEKFGPAVMHIKKQHVIGVGADGVEAFKHGRLCWLQIACKKKVYLFDILLLGARAFKNGLSAILEDKQMLKVIHDCRAIVGCLMGQFGVKLTNVFDTQVADVMCFYSDTGGFLPDRVSTLEEVASLHLKVPSSQLSALGMKSQLTAEEMEVWQKRPSPVPLLKLMALSVVHLQPLRLALLDHLMMDYMTLVDSYLNSSHYEPDELQHVSMETVMALPGGLRKLEQMRRERREWAADHYPVTERGLLARFSPRVPSPPQTSPESQGGGPTQADSLEPAISPSSTQVDPIHHKQPVTSVSSFHICASPDPTGRALIPAAVSGLRREMSCIPPGPVGVGRGLTFGRGRPLPPAIGRGFLPHISQAQALSSEQWGSETRGGMDSFIKPQPGLENT